MCSGVHTAAFVLYQAYKAAVMGDCKGCSEHSTTVMVDDLSRWPRGRVSPLVAS